MSGPQEPAQLVVAAVRPARWDAFERALLRGLEERRPGEEQRAFARFSFGETDVDGPDFAVVVEEDESKWHSGSATKPSKRGAQDA